MANLKLDLPFWEGFLVSNLERCPGASWITLTDDPALMPICSGRGHSCVQVHETVWRTIRDMPMLGDPVWLHEANRHRQNLPLRRVVKRARWLLLRNRENVPATQQPKLDELLAANQALMTVYVMKASLKELWHTTSAWQWRKA